MKYTVEITHQETGQVDARFLDVGADTESRRRIAAGLRIVAARMDPAGENWDVRIEGGPTP